MVYLCSPPWATFRDSLPLHAVYYLLCRGFNLPCYLTHICHDLLLSFAFAGVLDGVAGVAGVADGRFGM